MLENLSHLATVIVGCLTTATLTVIPLGRLWTRVQALEATSARHEQELRSLDTLGERLARIEAKLDVLMEERGRR